MLASAEAVAMIAVKDMDRARRFYEGTLGLKTLDEMEEVVVYASGRSRLNVYRSQYAGTNKATAVTWTVDNVDREVKALKEKGVSFEHYDLPGLKREGDLYTAQGPSGQFSTAWFKDPDGNILSLVSH